MGEGIESFWYWVCDGEGGLAFVSGLVLLVFETTVAWAEI